MWCLISQSTLATTDTALGVFFSAFTVPGFHSRPIVHAACATGESPTAERPTLWLLQHSFIPLFLHPNPNLLTQTRGGMQTLQATNENRRSVNAEKNTRLPARLVSQCNHSQQYSHHGPPYCTLVADFNSTKLALAVWHLTSVIHQPLSTVCEHSLHTGFSPGSINLRYYYLERWSLSCLLASSV